MSENFNYKKFILCCRSAGLTDGQIARILGMSINEFEEFLKTIKFDPAPKILPPGGGSSTEDDILYIDVVQMNITSVDDEPLTYKISFPFDYDYMNDENYFDAEIWDKIANSNSPVRFRVTWPSEFIPEYEPDIPIVFDLHSEYEVLKVDIMSDSKDKTFGTFTTRYYCRPISVESIGESGKPDTTNFYSYFPAYFDMNCNYDFRDFIGFDKMVILAPQS